MTKRSKKLAESLPSEKCCDFSLDEAQYNIFLEDGRVVKCCRDCLGFYFVNHLDKITSIISLGTGAEILTELTKRNRAIRK